MPLTLLKNGFHRLKQEFHTSKLSLRHGLPSQFYTSEASSPYLTLIPGSFSSTLLLLLTLRIVYVWFENSS